MSLNSAFNSAFSAELIWDNSHVSKFLDFKCLFLHKMTKNLQDINVLELSASAMAKMSENNVNNCKENKA